MTSVWGRNTLTWGLLGLAALLFALVIGPLPALADWQDYDDGQNDSARYDASSKQPGAVLYEVTEQMVLKDAAGNRVAGPVDGGRRSAIAELTGWAKLGTPLCPSWVTIYAPGIKQCTVYASGEDDLSLATRTGTLFGKYVVVIQDDNVVDGPEYVIRSGEFSGDADLSRTLVKVPLGFITNGLGTVDQTGEKFSFTGTFRLPFSIDYTGKTHNPHRSKGAYYLGDDGRPFSVKKNEKSIGFPTVRLEISFQ